jgi:hypothetical protein
MHSLVIGVRGHSLFVYRSHHQSTVHGYVCWLLL